MRSSWLPRLVIGALFAVVVILVAASMRESSEGGRAAAQSIAPSQATAPTRNGAVLTASRFLSALTLDALLDSARLRRLIERAASPEARHELLQLYADERDRVAESYRHTPRMARAALVGYRLDGFSRRSATVSIWAASIGGSRDFSPTSGWSTSTVDLAWNGRRWLVTSVEDSAGPSADWPIETLSSEALTFRAFDHVP